MRLKALNRITWNESPIWLRCLAVFVLANFATFFIVAVFFLKGSALDGGVRNGHYFFGDKGHRVWEVSSSIYYYSLIHTVTAIAGLPILMFAIIQFNCRRPLSEFAMRK